MACITLASVVSRLPSGAVNWETACPRAKHSTAAAARAAGRAKEKDPGGGGAPAGGAGPALEKPPGGGIAGMDDVGKEVPPVLFPSLPADGKHPPVTDHRRGFWDLDGT